MLRKEVRKEGKGLKGGINVCVCEGEDVCVL